MKDLMYEEKKNEAFTHLAIWGIREEVNFTYPFRFPSLKVRETCSGYILK